MSKCEEFWELLTKMGKKCVLKTGKQYWKISTCRDGRNSWSNCNSDGLQLSDKRRLPVKILKVPNADVVQR